MDLRSREKVSSGPTSSLKSLPWISIYLKASIPHKEYWKRAGYSQRDPLAMEHEKVSPSSVLVVTLCISARTNEDQDDFSGDFLSRCAAPRSMPLDWATPPGMTVPELSLLPRGRRVPCGWGNRSRRATVGIFWREETIACVFDPADS